MTRITGRINPYPFAYYPGQLTRTTKAVTLTTAATQILSTRRTRVVFMIYNNSDSTVFVGDSTVTTASGIPIQVGASYTNEGWTGPIYGIVEVGTANVRVEEN